jgi:hypothetical protein
MAGRRGKIKLRIWAGPGCALREAWNKRKLKIMSILYPVGLSPRISSGTLISTSGLIKGISFYPDYYTIYIRYHHNNIRYHHNNIRYHHNNIRYHIIKIK